MIYRYCFLWGVFIKTKNKMKKTVRITSISTGKVGIKTYETELEARESFNEALLVFMPNLFTVELL